MNRTLRRLLPLLGLAVAVPAVLLVAPVGADEVGPYNPPPPVYTSGCNPMAVGVYNTTLDAPQLNSVSGPGSDGQPLHGSVTATPAITTSGNTSCDGARVQFALQTKACGFWGCDWQDRTRTDWISLPASGQISVPLTMGCRDGDNSYRVKARVVHLELDFEDTPNGNQVPYLETKQDDHESDVVKGAC